MKRLDRKLSNIDWDYKALQDFHDFRSEAECKRFRYFLGTYQELT
jgi:hypothetical protein